MNLAAMHKTEIDERQRTKELSLNPPLILSKLADVIRADLGQAVYDEQHGSVRYLGDDIVIIIGQPSLTCEVVFHAVGQQTHTLNLDTKFKSFRHEFKKLVDDITFFKERADGNVDPLIQLNQILSGTFL
jgi:hypothetical protein